MSFRRPIVDRLVEAITSGPPLIHVVNGPRQVGKTTAVEQLLERVDLPHHMVSADSPVLHAPEWIANEWAVARAKAGKERGLLILDEVQKVPGWSEELKRLWDKERKQTNPMAVIVLGSSALLVGKGLSESLSGRFFLHRCMHWSWGECRTAFNWSLEQWIYFGGYPGAATFISNQELWQSYVADSLIETVIGRDVLQLNTVAKPALLRNLFGLAATFPAQIVSYNKMLGTLSDAGNTTTLAGYIKLLESAFFVSGLELFSRGSIRKRGSSPKLILWNNALITALSGRNFSQTVADRSWWGRLVENAGIAHVLNSVSGPEWNFTYWREGRAEVDLVVSRGKDIWAMEIKSGRGEKYSGLQMFMKKYPTANPIIIGEDGISLEMFFESDVRKWFV